MDANFPRRAVLAAGAGAAGAVLLSACSSSGSTTPARSAAGTSGAAGGNPVAALADVAVGSSIAVKLPGGPGLVTRTSSTDVVCFSAVCTHQGCTVAPHGAIFQCPCHQSQFDPRTGEVTAGPAPSPLEKVAVKVVGGEIVTA